MPLVSGNEILQDALKHKYGVGAFNTHNLEITQAIITAAEEMDSPVIVAMSQGALRYAGSILPEIVKYYANRAKVPVAIHLDHGADYNICMRAIQLGFTSVMLDKSSASEEENVRETKRLVETAHALGVSVEAEIGRLGGIEEHVSTNQKEVCLTTSKDALRFVTLTGVDSLAVAIGTSHGMNKGIKRPYIDLDRLSEIHEIIPETPLVMHGASEVPQELVKKINEYGGTLTSAVGIYADDVKDAIQRGIAKINTETDLKLAYTAAVREVLSKNTKEIDPRKTLGPARECMKETVKNRIKLFYGL